MLITGAPEKNNKSMIIYYNKTDHLWVPSGGEYSDPDPTMHLHVFLSIKHEYPFEECKHIIKSHMS